MMLRRFIILASAAILMTALSAKAQYRGYHVGYTHYSPYTGLHHYGYTRVGHGGYGDYRGYHYGGYAYGGHGYGGYGYGHGGYGGHGYYRRW